uniref:Agmatine coumaroyltransferase n=2 Tax=Zea mays TaxID=4577 RepID=B6SGG3_MAIZE|nr:agmatine coumaroyltransferase [Zea mays]|eukprot:NP_001146851.1 agmatine coumaroyltransferase [Zea mays]
MATTMAANDPTSIRVVSRRLVKASDASIQPHVMSLSNLDLYVCDSQLGTLCVYPNAGGGFSARIPSLFESLLPSLLNYLYPFAGRLVTNPSSGLPELHCHNQGAELVVGEVGVALGSLNYGATKDSFKKMVLPFPRDVLLSVQLLSFACGGFSVMWWINHLVGDGHVGATIVRTWSQLARTGDIGGAPPLNYDRSVFRPRSPPSYSDSVAATFTTFDEKRLPNALTAEASFVDRVYYVEASDIAALRDTAAAATTAQRPTRVEALSAYLWKALADVVAACPRSNKERCRMGWWVSARRRVTAPKLVALMPGYLGNVTTYALGDAPAEEIVRKPLAEVAAMVRDAITSVDYDEYLQEMVDWVEVHKTEGLMEAAVIGVGAPTLNQSVMTTFPLDTDFGFGQATLATTVSDYGRLCSAFLSVGARPGGDGSWLVTAYIWPQLAAALESDGIFKLLTAEYLGLAM